MKPERPEASVPLGPVPPVNVGLGELLVLFSQRLCLRGLPLPGILRVWSVGRSGRTSNRFGEGPGDLAAALPPTPSGLQWFPQACAAHCDQTPHLTRLPSLGPAAPAGSGASPGDRKPSGRLGKRSWSLLSCGPGRS